MPPKRYAITPLEKWKICVERQKSGQKKGEMTLEEFCQLFPRPDGKPMPISTMSDILKQSEQLLANPPSGAAAIKTKSRKEKFPIFEHFLIQWIDRATEKKVQINDDIILAQARRLVTELGEQITDNQPEDYTGFDISRGWLRGFKFRHGEARQKLSGEAGSTDPTIIEAAREKIRATLNTYQPRDVYNCDETSFQYNLRPSTTITRKGKTVRGDEKAKIRITVFLTCNADGSDKQKLLVINKWKQPQAFTTARVNANNLPVNYHWNKTAWMNAGIWYQFLYKLNEHMRILGRHIILISANAPSHPSPENPPQSYPGPPPPILTHIRLEYLEPNMTAFLQPLDAGIIAAFKAVYRRKYADLMVQRFNRNPNETVEWKIDILQAIFLAVDSWEDIPPKTIFNCWQKTKILPAIDRENVGSKHDEYLESVARSTRNSIASLLARGPYNEHPTEEDIKKLAEEYLMFSEDQLPIYSDTDPDDINMAEIVSDGIEAGFLYLDSSAEIAEPETSIIPQLPPPEPITPAQAVNYMEKLQQFLQSLPISEIDDGTSKPVNISDTVIYFRRVQKALERYYSVA